MGGGIGPRRTPGFLIYDFLTGRESLILGVWAAPGARETFQKGGGLRPPPFWRVSGRPGPPRPPKSTIPGRSKNHIFRLGRPSSRISHGPFSIGPQVLDVPVGGTSTGQTHVGGCQRGVLAEGGLVIWWKICRFGVLGGPGRPRIPLKRKGALPPTFLKGFWAARGRPES